MVQRKQVLNPRRFSSESTTYGFEMPMFGEHAVIGKLEELVCDDIQAYLECPYHKILWDTAGHEPGMYVWRLSPMLDGGGYANRQTAIK
jgi:hypothetical protein